MSKDIYHIASDYFSGRITGDDRRYLHQWLNESPENKDIFAELEKVWQITGSLSNTSEPDVNTEWNRFVNQRETIENRTILSYKTPHTKVFYFLRIAAVILPALLIISAVFYFSKKSQTQQNTWVTVNSGNQQLVQLLPDGTEVLLNKKSALSYPQKFNKKERLVKLTGEGYFKVTKLGKPFIVNAGYTSIRVLGTHFNVRNYATTNTEVFVEEGSVLFSDIHNNKNKAILNAGEIGLYKGSSNPIEKENLKTANALAWITKKLNFENTTLRLVKSDISNYFNKTIILPGTLDNCLFTGEFNNPEVTNVLNVISLSVGCSYKINNDTIYFEGGGCN